jgi:hemerythrin
MKIIHILNDIYDYQKDKTIPLDLENILNDLLTYTKTHFADEEGLLRLVDFPRFNEHKVLHDRMAQQTQALREEYLKCHEDLSWELMGSLKDWWLNHIQSDDKRYVPYLV